MALGDAIKDKLGSIWVRIKKNVDRSAFVVFLLLLVLMMGLYGYENSQAPPEFESPQRGKIDRKLPNEKYELCVDYIQGPTNIEDDPQLRSIRDFNIFDYKYVRDREELEKAADKKFEQAAQLFAEEKLEEAQKILKEITLSWPSHLKSRELLEKIDQQLNATPTPTPTPKRGAAPPGAPVGPGPAGRGAPQGPPGMGAPL